VLKAVRAVEEVETELSKQKDALKEVRITQKTVGENVAKSRKALAEVSNLQRQSQRFEEKLGHLRKQAKAKAEASDAALCEMQSELSAEEVRLALICHYFAVTVRSVTVTRRYTAVTAKHDVQRTHRHSVSACSVAVSRVS
jgi:uncharacterized protein (DUF3084 family)